MARTRSLGRAAASVAAIAMGVLTLSACIPHIEVTRTYTYSVVTDGPVWSDLEHFRATAQRVFNDHRSWHAAGIGFTEVPSGGDFTLVLARPLHVEAYHPVCSSEYSCQVGRYVIINDIRFLTGSPNWPGPVDWYRVMVLNHELGYWLGLGHQFCGDAGLLAPIMQQQSIDMQGCAINPWPLPVEIDRLR